MHYKPKVFQEQMTLDNFDLRAGTAEILTGATTYHKKCVYFRNGQFGVKVTYSCNKFQCATV